MWTWASAGAMVIVLIGGGVWLRHRKPPQLPATASASVLTVPASITLTGKIRAAHVTSVDTAALGTIDSFEASVGDEVYQGQVLARIGSQGLESARTEAADAVQKAQNRVEAAEKTVTAAQLEASRAHADAERSRAELDRVQKIFDRQKTLSAAGATPRLTYEKAERDYGRAREEWEAVSKADRLATEHVQDSLRALDGVRRVLLDKNKELEDAEADAASAVVEAPVDGLIVGRNGELGQRIEEVGKDLFQIATDLYDLEAVADAKPDLRKRIRSGEPVLVVIPDLQGTGYSGTVKAIQDEQVVASFQSPTPAIRPGMVAEIRLKPQ